MIEIVFVGSFGLALYLFMAGLTHYIYNIYVKYYDNSDYWVAGIWPVTLPFMLGKYVIPDILDGVRRILRKVFNV